MDDKRNGEAKANADTEGHAVECQPATPEDQEWLAERINRQPAGRVTVRLDDEQDVSGHLAFEDPTLVRVMVQDDDDLDTEGHAITIRLPSAGDADAFRRRLLLTGVLAGTIVLGGAGAALTVSHDAESPQAETTSQIEDVSYEDATPYNGTV